MLSASKPESILDRNREADDPFAQPILRQQFVTLRQSDHEAPTSTLAAFSLPPATTVEEEMHAFACGMESYPPQDQRSCLLAVSWTVRLSVARSGLPPCRRRVCRRAVRESKETNVDQNHRERAHAAVHGLQEKSDQSKPEGNPVNFRHNSHGLPLTTRAHGPI